VVVVGAQADHDAGVAVRNIAAEDVHLDHAGAAQRELEVNVV
jgi:hypothetical protein